MRSNDFRYRNACNRQTHLFSCNCWRIFNILRHSLHLKWMFLINLFGECGLTCYISFRQQDIKCNIPYYNATQPCPPLWPGQMMRRPYTATWSVDNNKFRACVIKLACEEQASLPIVYKLITSVSQLPSSPNWLLEKNLSFGVCIPG